jgi:YVTN family beta-propeller protein
MKLRIDAPFARRLTRIGLAALLLSGCSNGAPALVPQTSRAAPPALRPQAKAANLYVADYAAVTVYAPKGGSLLRTIDNLEPSSIAFDGAGNLYVANVPVRGNGNVTVFRAGKNSVLRKLTQGLDDPRALIFDPSGNLYVANSYFRVAEFAPGQDSPTRYYKVFYGSAMLFDAAGRFYVASDPSPYGGRGGSKVLVYGAGGSHLYTITRGLNSPVSLALGSSGNVFVANFGGNDVAVYAPGKSKLLRTISKGVKGPYCLRFDGSGNLYVANNLASTVTVYDNAGPQVTRTIKQGVSHPTALAFDSSGNLYVANAKNVTVYAPGKDAPFETIAKSIKSPIALGFGP